MSNFSNDALFELIKSLSKSEKRQFKLYAQRLESNQESKYVLLFELFDKADLYDEKLILNAHFIKKPQLSNLKAHLYKQILVSLRMNPTNQNLRILLREQLDFATVLYHKGLFKQALKILDKTKNQAIANEEKYLAYEIVELEKVIESQYITRQNLTRADELISDSENLSRQNVMVSKLSNLSLKLYQLMLTKGYVKDDIERENIKNYFFKSMPKTNLKHLGFREKLWYFKAHLAYFFLIQDLVNGYKYASKWVELFHENEEMIKHNPVWYIKGINYLLDLSFLLNYQTIFEKTLSQFQEIIKRDCITLNANNTMLIDLCLYTHQLNNYFLNGNFDKSIPTCILVLKFLKNNAQNIDNHHVMVFYYKIACIYFGLADYNSAILYLNKIILNKIYEVKEELLGFAKILSLISHFEAALDDKIEYQLKSTYAFLLKMNSLQNVQKEILLFLKKASLGYPHDIKVLLKQLHENLLPYTNHPFEKRAFYYLDMISWIESKLSKQSILEVIKSKKNRLR